MVSGFWFLVVEFENEKPGTSNPKRETPNEKPETMNQAETPTIKALRGFLLIILVLGVLGTGAELLLIEHFEDVWQYAPLILMGLSLAVLGWRVVDRGRVSLRVFQGTMLLFVVSGFVGFWMHYQGNVEFEREMYPTMEGFELLWAALQGATPSLAPGTMIQLGLLGLAYTYRHPALSTHKTDTNGEP